MKRHRDDMPADDGASELPLCGAVAVAADLITLKCELPQRHSGYHLQTVYWGGGLVGAEKG